MGSMVEDVTTKTEKLEVESKPTKVEDNLMEKAAKVENDKPSSTEPSKIVEENGLQKESKPDVEIPKEENIAVEVEPKTGVSFPVKLADGKQLNSVGLRKKSILGLGIKIYGFGIYADNEKLKELMRTKIGKAPAKPTKEMYQLVIDSDVGMMLRMVIVYGSLTMNMVKKNFDEGLGGSIKKLNGGRKDDELTNKVMGGVSDAIKLSAGSVIEVTKSPGYVLQTKGKAIIMHYLVVMFHMKDEVVSKVESELLSRAYFHMYLGDDPFDKEAKENFGMSLLSLF
ncbi:hypothetical protein IFM89_032003 [Coptis chinensis]|uniref:Chalcone isomerase n=1 Tax=Coptis chinensis TaxID=261450 RepID=A0A835GZ51_9MAGN|nr:hypothetical protein IFM89_032003 [Coptis chinensis]